MKIILAFLRFQNDLERIIQILWKSKNYFKINIINTNLEESYIDGPRIKYLKEYIYEDLINFFPSTFKIKVFSYLILINPENRPRILRIIVNTKKLLLVNLQ